MKKKEFLIKIAFIIVFGVFQIPNIYAQSKPNIILVYTDDISARELPIYGSDTWTSPLATNTSDMQYRANTPVLDMMANNGCYIETTWASVVCSPSRAMMMTGRYPHIHKWWGNKTIGAYRDPADGRSKSIPLFVSSPKTIGHIAKEGGYGTFWAGKTQMRTDRMDEFGFDEAVFTAGGEKVVGENPYTDFELAVVNSNLTNKDSENPVGGTDTSTYAQRSWYWKTSASLMTKNDSGEYDFEWWPNTEESRSNYSVNTYGPDVELDLIFDFMDRKVGDNEPFFIYHTSHLGHDGFDFLKDGAISKWPGTPKVTWDGTKYTRTTPNITGSEGIYNTNNSITDNGIHHHVNYLDYQMSLYLDKLKELGIEDNTLVIFTSDNGTSGFGKNQIDGQRGTHVPFIVYGPGLGITKKGKQDVLLNMSDILPTIAEIAGVEIPCDYEINGESFWGFLTTDKVEHRDFVYGYRDGNQIIRNDKIMIDGKGKVYDVTTVPSDLNNFTVLTSNVNTTLSTTELEDSKNELLSELTKFNTFSTDQNGLPDSSVNRMTCTGTTPDPDTNTDNDINITFDPTPNSISTNTELPNPIKFTVANIPNNSTVNLNVRIYPEGENITKGGHIAQSIGALDVNSNTSDIDNPNIKFVTQIDTPKSGHITRTYTIKNVGIRGTSIINNMENYTAALRFVNGGVSGAVPLAFSSVLGEQMTAGNSKNAVFKLNTLVADNTLGIRDFFTDDISKNVYPNPTTTTLYINNIETTSYKVVNLLGQIVKEVPYNKNGELNVSDLLSGVYFLLTDKGIAKFVKL